MISTPFTGKMDEQHFNRIFEALKGNGSPADEAYQATEAIHREFFGQNRYSSRESHKTTYYRNHESKK
jgi:hypothetical protein